MSTPVGEQPTQPEGEGGTQQPQKLDEASAQAALAKAAQEAAEGGDDGDDEGLDPKVKAKIERANREAKALRDRVKALEPLAKQATDRTEAEKSEMQKLTDKLAAKEVELSELRVMTIRRDAAEAANLPPRFAKFINAAEPEEALAQAKELAKAIKPEGDEGGNKQQQRGPADLRQGSRGTPTPKNKEQSADDFIRGMAGRL